MSRGGIGPNIAYTMALLGERPRLMGAVGVWAPGATAALLMAVVSVYAWRRLLADRVASSAPLAQA